jgi:hypothetical protein
VLSSRVKPTFAGIDPYNFRIDGISDDNVKDVTTPDRSGWLPLVRSAFDVGHACSEHGRAAHVCRRQRDPFVGGIILVQEGLKAPQVNGEITFTLSVVARVNKGHVGASAFQAAP